MNKSIYLFSILCTILIIDTPIVLAVFSSEQDLNQFPNQQSNVPASFQTDPYYGSNLGGYAYNNPQRDAITKSRTYSGNDINLGEPIILRVADTEPKQVRQSALEEQDLPIYVYFKGITSGSLLSPLTKDVTATDPLSGISNIPPIDSIQITWNQSSNTSKYVRFVNYIPPARGRASLNNLGYAIIYLKKLESENQTPEGNIINLDLHAKIFLKLEEGGLFGVTEQDLVVKKFTTNEDFLKAKEQYSFYTGKGYLKATRISADSVTLQVYNKDLFPLALASSPSAPSTSGIRATTAVTLTKNQVSPPISFGYTGNPLTDLFQIKLNDVSVPTDKAEIEYNLDGKTIKRKVPLNGKLYAGSNWIIKSLSPNSDQEKVQGKLIKDQSDLENVAEEFNLNPQQKNQIAFLLENGKLLQVETHRMQLESQYSSEQRSVEVKVITENGDNILYNYKSIPKETAELLEEKYCGNTRVNVDKNDLACEAVNRYKDLISTFPSAPEISKAKEDLGDIYADFLIDFKPCNIKEDKSGVIDKKDCKLFQWEMADLAYYYYAQIGKENKITDRFGTSGGQIYLEDEGISLKLKRVITQKQEQSTALVKVYTSDNRFNEVPLVKFDNLSLGTIIYEKEGEYVWRVEDIQEQAVNLRLYKVEKDGKFIRQQGPQTTKTLKLNTDEEVIVEFPKTNEQNTKVIDQGRTVKVQVSKIDTNYEAYVTILPGAGRGVSTSDFKVHVNIDPRPFKLTPEQIEAQIKGTKEIIETLNNIITKLDEYISTLKKLCLGVFAFLTLKNSFTGTRNIARKEVASSFKQRCAREAREGKTSEHPKFDTADSCLNHYSDQIKSSTDKTEKFMDDINTRIKGKTGEDLASTNIATSEEEKECGKYNEFQEASIGANQEGLVRSYRDCLFAANIKNDPTIDKTFQADAIAKSKDIGVIDKVELYRKAVKYARENENAGLNSSNPKDIQSTILSLQEAESTAKKENKGNIITSIKKQTTDTQGVTTGTGFIPSGNTLKPIALTGVSKYTKRVIEEGNIQAAHKEICKELGGEYTPDTANSLVVQLCVKKDQPNQPLPFPERITKLKNESSTGTNGLPEFIDTGLYTKYINGEVNQQDCESSSGEWKGGKCQPKIFSSTESRDTVKGIKNSGYGYGNLIARYNSDGDPYCYPVGNGNYVVVQERYSGNKDPKRIKVMNVGANGVIECGGGDDLYAENGDPTFLDANEKIKNEFTRKEQYFRRCTPKGGNGAVKDGDSVGTVDNQEVKCQITSKEAVNALTAPKCIDAMDPLDCKLLFNFCDPVMCPSSRCTLGGRVEPRNVISSGLVGSVVLCAPNIQEGIYLPVCLTGISAGLKNIRSILEGYASCLEINLKQGKNVGFCDYIRSVGICELVWREAYSLLGISGSVLDWAAGKLFSEPKGGGEYLSFQSSLDNVGASAKVFTEEYKTTYTAQFLSQSTEEIGSQLCRLSVNGKLPTIGKILDQLTEPENPPQFTAFFDETPYASPGESTGIPNVQPGTKDISLYKVFYHIYAGTGYFQGSYAQPQSLFAPQGTESGTIQQPIVYSVYLRNQQTGYPPLYMTLPGESAQFQARIESGKFAQETVQKPGRKGYKEICVNINGVEQCGFGKASSSFGLNELKDALNEKEAEKEITSAEECVPDSRKTPNYSVAKLGALGASEIAGGGVVSGLITSGIDENLYSKGISRVCSTNEPTQEPGRWKRVGTCGQDENKKSRGECWIDVKSISIDDKKFREATQNEIERRANPNIQLIDEATSKYALQDLNEQRNTLIEKIRALVEEAKKAGKAPSSGISEIEQIDDTGEDAGAEEREQPEDTDEIVPVPGPTPLPNQLTPAQIDQISTLLSVPNAKKNLISFVYQEAKAKKIDPFLVLAMITKESNWRSNVVSKPGAKGIMQLMPIAVQDLENYGYTFNGDYSNDKEVIKAGIEYLKIIQYSYLPAKQYNYPATPENIAAVYNLGIGSFKKAKADVSGIKETRDYVAFVKLTRAKLKTQIKVSPQPVVVTGNVIWPVDSPTITSCYGVRIDPKDKTKNQDHKGIDLNAKIGDTIKTVAAGTVTFIKTGCKPKVSTGRCGCGNYVKVEHAEGYSTMYCHLSEVSVTKDQKIKQGEEVGKAGNTGRVTGPHLHLEIYSGKDHINPLEYLPVLPNNKKYDSCKDKM